MEEPSKKIAMYAHLLNISRYPVGVQQQQAAMLARKCSSERKTKRKLC